MQNYKLPFTITNKMLDYVSSISEKSRENKEPQPA